MAIQIDTNKVKLSAAEIAKINAEIENDYSIVHTAIQKLTTTWKGNASEYSIGAIKHIEKLYREARYSSINQLVSFLNNQVSDSYELVESSAVFAADAFK